MTNEQAALKAIPHTVTLHCKVSASITQLAPYMQQTRKSKQPPTCEPCEQPTNWATDGRARNYLETRMFALFSCSASGTSQVCELHRQQCKHACRSGLSTQGGLGSLASQHSTKTVQAAVNGQQAALAGAKGRKHHCKTDEYQGRSCPTPLRLLELAPHIHDYCTTLSAWQPRGLISCPREGGLVS